MTNQERPEDELAVDKGQLLAKTTHITIFFLLPKPPGCGARGTTMFGSALSVNCCDKKHPTRQKAVQQELRVPQERRATCECINKRKINLSWQNTFVQTPTIIPQVHTYRKCQNGMSNTSTKSQGDRMHLIYAWLQNPE